MQLRQYQLDSIEGLRNGFRSGHNHQVLSAATGAGKSVIAVSMLKSAIEKGSRAMFICDRRVLVDQFSKHLDRHGVDHGVFMAKHWRYRPHAQVQVASIQTLERMRSWPAVSFIMVDEIHAVMRKSLKDFMTNHPQIKVIGLTATPFQAEMGNYFTSVTNVVTMEQLVKDKFLVPFRVFASKEIDTSGIKVVAGEWQQEEVEKRSLSIVGDVVSDYVRLSSEVFGKPRKTIVFSSGVDHGKALVEQFAAVGLNFVQISYLDDEEYKRDVLAEFAKPDSQIMGVVSSEILTRGFDQTDVEHVVIAKPLRKAFSMHVQIVGRGSRPHEGKEFCLIQDNSGNWLRFIEDWEDLYHNGAHDLKSDLDSKTRKEKTEQEKKESKCPKCGHLWGSAEMCPCCGYMRVKRSSTDFTPGQIEEIAFDGFKAKDGSFVTKQDFYSELLSFAASKGYKTGWVAWKYKERFGVFPRGLHSSHRNPSLSTVNWIRSRWIAAAKGSTKEPKLSKEQA